ncbi:MAG: hypothetical protein HY074_08795 [Deltaproteobacteria bacterium]|nr:hypothetical protein [Deltaproteobacteria bacterium]
MAAIEAWDIETFSKEFAQRHSPELLVVILIEALSEIERQWRYFGCEVPDESALKPSAVRINRNGKVSIEASATPSARAVAMLFMKYFPESALVHPELQLLLARCLGKLKAMRVWGFRAQLLDYLSEIGMEGPRFQLAGFFADHQAYNRAATLAIVGSACDRVRRLIQSRRRRQAVAELQFLLELSPVNSQALELWRQLKPGRAELFLRACYCLLIAAISVVSLSVMAEKLQLPFLNKGPKKLVIEPIQATDEIYGAGSDRVPASSGAVEEFSREVAASGLKRGAVELDFEGDTRVYFDGAPDAVPAHSRHETVWLQEGPHEVTVCKTGQSPVMAHLSIQNDRIVVLTDRASSAAAGVPKSR